MLTRTRMPGTDDDALGERLLIREQVEICAIVGRPRTETAKTALKKAATSDLEPVRKAAEAALAAPLAKQLRKMSSFMRSRADAIQRHVVPHAPTEAQSTDVAASSSTPRSQPGRSPLGCRR